MRAISTNCGIAVTPPVNSNDSTISFEIAFLPGKLLLASGNAAIELTKMCSVVAVTEIKTLLKKYLVNGTQDS